MNYQSAKTNIAKLSGTIAVAIVLVGVAAFAPAKTHAFDPIQLVDPLCLWSGCGSKPAPTTVVNKKYVNNSNNTGNIGSPGGTVVNGNNNTTVGGNGRTTPVAVAAATPSYTYGGNGGSSYNSLGGNCYPVSSTANAGDSVSWRVSSYGGNGSYYYSWSGNDGLSGSGSNVNIRYNSPGTKNATVTIVSGSQTITRNCSPSVYVQQDSSYYDNNNYYNNGYNNNNYYDNGYNNNYYDNAYNSGYSNYSQLSVSCVANASFAPIGQNVQWTANASGGNGGYTYRWTGTDGVSSSGSYLGVNYGTPGVKYASVTVYSSGQSITRDCSGSVTVGVRNDQYGNNNGNGNNGNLEIACFADADRTRIGVPVTWGVEATGGNGNFSYSWSGSEGLSGSQRSAVTSYSTPGTKNATVTITSGGISASKLCGNVVTVVSPSTGANNSGATVTRNPQADNSSFTGSSLFSLQNVPWGWVAILVILVLVSMVMYLLFTRRELEIKK
ncbi:MAG: Immunoglobulin-like repeat containing protein domain [Candidatus Taylorbacteria bacterium]|nr:Immunoglobulin-like repeat containing protein domain [Candidatus Taylorbacteria bacterium]